MANAGPFLADFLEFLSYATTHQVRVTALHSHIPLRHLKELAGRFRAKEPFHPISWNAEEQIRCQRDERRIDFMDRLATELDLLDRSEWGYLQAGKTLADFTRLPGPEQIKILQDAFWAMDWEPFYPWAHVVEALDKRRQDLRAWIDGYLGRGNPDISCATMMRETLADTDAAQGNEDSWLWGLFWVVCRPLEYMGLWETEFQKDKDGFYYPATLRFCA